MTAGYDQMATKFLRAVTQRDDARARLTRIAALHQPAADNTAWCAHCGHAWPCESSTIAGQPAVGDEQVVA